MRRRVDIACGLVVRPEVVFLDEPTTGLDPRSRQAIWELVTTFKEAGIATLLTTQYLEEADALSDRIIVIDHGTIVAQGTADELKERTGGTYCEIVPRNPADLHALADALGPLLPAASRAAISPDSDRISHARPRRTRHVERSPVAFELGEHRAGRHRVAQAVAGRRIPLADWRFGRRPRTERIAGEVLS